MPIFVLVSAKQVLLPGGSEYPQEMIFVRGHPIKNERANTMWRMLLISIEIGQGPHQKVERGLI